MFSFTKKWLYRTCVASVLVAALPLLGGQGRCWAQQPNWRPDDPALRGRMPQAYSQFIQRPQPVEPTLSEEERQRVLHLQKVEEQQHRLARLRSTVAYEGKDKNHELKVVAHGRKFEVGHVSSADDEGFTLLDSETNQESRFAYSEIEAVYVVRTPGENTRRTLEATGFGLLFIVSLPLAIFGGIIGWDGC
jgi:hypothetical protein